MISFDYVFASAMEWVVIRFETEYFLRIMSGCYFVMFLQLLRFSLRNTVKMSEICGGAK